MSEKTTHVFHYDDPRVAVLESALAAERARADKLVAALDEARGHVVMACANTSGVEYMTFSHMLDKYPRSKPRIIELIDAALSDYRTAREAQP